MEPILFAMTGQVIEAEYWLYTVVAIAGLPSGERAGARLKKVQTALKKLAQWEKSCPENFHARSLLCQAEHARITNDPARASFLYEEAIDAAEEEGFVHLVALGAEQSAVLHRVLGHETLANGYRERARAAYARWGALTRVLALGEGDDLSRRAMRTGATGIVTTVETGQGSLDVLTLLKASHAIAGEIALPGTLERLLTVVMENAGASRGVYIRVEGTQLIPEAEGNAGGAVRVLPSSPPAELPLAGSVIRYVARTGETVTVQRDVPDRRFSGDEYLKARPPAALLCIPVMHHGAMQGLLYLENGHMQGSFSADRRELLRMLTGQIAISLENARLVGKDGCAVCVGDVSGKGLPASLLMANLQATLRGQVLSSSSPGVCLGRANTLLHRSTSPEKFATLILGVLDPASHRFEYANAGQEHPFVIRADGNHTVLSAGGPPLAMLEWFDYGTEVCALAPGDTIVIYSDGIPEALNPEGVLFGHERLHALLAGWRGVSPEMMIERTLDAVAVHTRGAPQSDDITLVILQRQA